MAFPITFASVVTNPGGTGSTLTVSLPAHAVGDVIEIFVAKTGNVAWSAPAGWTIKQQLVTSGSAAASATGTLLYRLVLSGDSLPLPNPVCTLGATVTRSAVAITKRGADINGVYTAAPWLAFSGSTGNANPIRPPAITTVTPDGTVYHYYCQRAATNAPEPTSYTQTNEVIISGTLVLNVSERNVADLNTLLSNQDASPTSGARWAGMIAATPSVITGPVLLEDDFNDNSRDTARWTLGSIAFENAAVGVDEANQQIEITPLALTGTPAIYGYKSLNTYDFTAREAAVRIAADLDPNTEAWLVVAVDADNYLRTWFAAGNLFTRSRVIGNNSNQDHGAFSFATHTYWRIRHDEVANEIVWEYSANGITWSELRRLATPFAITSVSVYLSGGTGASVASPGLVKFDDFNLRTPVLALAIENSAHTHTADAIVLTQAHLLATESANHGHSAENLTLSQVHSLAIADGSHSHTAEDLSLVETNQLTVADSNHSHSADSLLLAQAHELIIESGTHAHTGENLALSTADALGIADSTHAHTSENLVLTQVHSLAIAESAHSHSTESVAITSSTDLVIQSAAHEHSAETMALTGVHVLTISDAAHSHTGDSVALTQSHSLAAQDASHAHSVELLTLTQTHELVTADSGHSHTADDLTLTQIHTLAVQSANHQQSAGNVELSTPGALGIQSANHGHTSETLALSQTHELAIADSQHIHTAENLTTTVVQHLVIESADHDHSSESVTLAQIHELSLQAGIHSHTVENVELASEGTLGIASSAHSHNAESLGLTQAHLLTVADSTHAQAAESLSLTEAANLNIESAVHSHSAEEPGLTQVHDLIINGSSHSHLAQNVLLGSPDDLTISNSFHAHTARGVLFNWTVPADVYEVPADSWVFVVPAENRIFEA